MENLDQNVVRNFGAEWGKFDHSRTSELEESAIFETYFSIFPWNELPANAIGFDLGCGSGRWARLVAPRVGELHCIDASDAALEVAKNNLRHLPNLKFHLASVDAIPLERNSADFGYCLGVLHHVPDTEAGLQQCVSRLKPGAPFLLYLYYAFDNRPAWFRLIWRCSELLRKNISGLPFGLKSAISDVLAGLLYWPLARMARLAERCGLNADSLPLAAYRNRSFYMMRNDALDRFGTRLEKRFTKPEILSMMRVAGLEHIVFSEAIPYWCAVGRRKRENKI